jgi:YebC/PmpR family DNA-binding regulatory protein
MSGHSKWKTIQHKKGAADAKRGKIFSKMSKELTVTARNGGGDPDKNPALRTLIQKAKDVNMPSDNIDRAIKKGTGELEGATYEEAVYEGYVAGGIAVVVKALTDNKNRAASEIRHIFNKNNTEFAQQGAVTRNFERKGQIFVDSSTVDEDQLMELVIDAGAEDMKRDGDQFEILTEPSSFTDVVDALKEAGIATVSSEVSLVPYTYVNVTDKSTASSVMKFVYELEDNEDVQNVYTNMNVDDAILEEMEQQK